MSTFVPTNGTRGGFSPQRISATSYLHVRWRATINELREGGDVPPKLAADMAHSLCDVTPLRGALYADLLDFSKGVIAQAQADGERYTAAQRNAYGPRQADDDGGQTNGDA